MKIQDQVCSFEQAVKLKDLGVSQESLFHRKHYPYNKDLDGKEVHQVPTYPVGNYYFAAFTVSELGVMLNCSADGGPHHDMWNDQLHNKVIELLPIYKNEADFRAEILIYGIENKFDLLSIEEIKNRLKS